jgi:hypothetical protein
MRVVWVDREGEGMKWCGGGGGGGGFTGVGDVGEEGEVWAATSARGACVDVCVGGGRGPAV